MNTKNTGVAAVLSFIIPGAGLIYCERITSGVVVFGIWAVMVWLALVHGWYGLFLFAGIAWLWGIFESRNVAQKHNDKVNSTHASNGQNVSP